MRACLGRAVGRVGSRLGWRGWRVERMVVLRGLNTAPMVCPTPWKVAKYDGMAATGSTDETLSIKAN